MLRAKRAFTLVELLVVMAIIAVLIGLAIGAISIAQRVSRDNERRAALVEISAAINAYYASSSRNPTNSQVTLNGNDVSIAGTLIDLRGAAEATNNFTDANSTRYCYNRTGGGYHLGALLEDGSWDYDLSTDRVGTENCSSTPIIS